VQHTAADTNNASLFYVTTVSINSWHMQLMTFYHVPVLQTATQPAITPSNCFAGPPVHV
jgi:hypothetical protein